jgi:hypothetical protein
VNSEKAAQINVPGSLDELNLLSMAIYDELEFAKKAMIQTTNKVFQMDF